MKCPNCKNKIKLSTKYCPNCGHKINSLKLILKLIGTIFLALFLLLLILYGFGVYNYNVASINRALNNKDFIGKKILIEISPKDEQIINNFKKELFNNYHPYVHVELDRYNKLVIYAPKEFRAEYLKSLLPEKNIEIKSPDSNIVLTKKDIKKASVNASSDNDWYILIDFNNEGTVKFAKLTKKLIGKKLPIYYDGELIANPIIKEPITGGSAMITAEFSYKEAMEMAKMISPDSQLNIKILKVK